MKLKALEQGYNSVYIFLPLGSIFNFNFNRKYSSPNCHSRSRHFAQHHRARYGSYKPQTTLKCGWRGLKTSTSSS